MMWNTAEGFLVVGSPMNINDTIYHGVNTNAWPLGMPLGMPLGSKIAESICEASYCDLRFPMLVDFRSAQSYCRMCEESGIISRMLFCEVLTDSVSRDLPHFKSPHKRVCLGFDYAYPSGDYYSAIANDIILAERPLSKHWRQHLNEYGLFSTEDITLSTQHQE